MNLDTMNFDNIPRELKELDRWVCWRMEERDGKPTKVPVNAGEPGTKRAMSDNPSTWSDFNTAIAKMKQEGLPGIGFVFNGDGLLGVDVDDCRNPDTDAYTEHGIEIINTLDSYTELSPSGKGVHVICRGKLPPGKKQTFIHLQDGIKAHLGIYDTGRFFCMTGNVLDDDAPDVEERTNELAVVHEKYINVKKTGKNGEKIDKNVNKKPFFENGDQIVTDDEVFDRINKSQKRDVVFDLLNGNWKGKYPSCSEADLALMNHLAYYADRNEHIMWSIFSRCGLFRQDEHERNPKKFQNTLEKAISDCRECYFERRERLRLDWESRNKNSRKQHDQQAINSVPEIDQGLDALVKSVKEKPFEDTTSDMGRSRIFSSKYSGKIVWCGDIKSWLAWDGKRWNEDRLLYIVQLAKKMIDDMIVSALRAISNATGEEEVSKAKSIFKETAKAKSERSIKAMIELAKSDISIQVENLDRDPLLLNCQNGIVDLRTGEIKEHDPELMMSRITAANYVPGKKFELFGDFLKLITCGDDDLIDYFQQICGMSAIGKVFHEGMAIFYGNGQNGKSTFLNAICKVFGDYASSINPEMLMSQRDGRQPVGITRLDGKRFVTAMELEEGRRMSSSMLKQLASTDPITGRELYQKDRTFLPTHTLIMATNFLPKIGSSDVGTWRRIAVVPFKAVIEAKTQIKDYADVLYRTDGDAILTWIIEGAMRYIKNDYRIGLPGVVEAATKEYKAAEDWIGNFIYECCELGAHEEQGGRLYDAYAEWCEKNSEFKRRPRDFAAALETAGYEKRKTMHGALWSGLKLIQPADQYSTRYKTVKSAEKQSSFLDADELDEITRSHM